MADMNRVCLAGRLTRAVELRYTPGGKAVGRIDLAINYRRRLDSGETKDEVTFVECEVWGAQAEACAKHLGKGHGVLIEGRLQLDRWEKDGEPRSKLKVVCRRVHFLGAPRPKPEGQEAPRRDGKPNGNREEHSADVDSPEVPF